MAALIKLLLLLALIGLFVLGASWGFAYSAVGDVLGNPPPEMGTQHTSLLWRGSGAIRGHPRAWRFTYGPTHIPGAPLVRIYVSLTGRVLLTEPADLPARVADLHMKGYR